MVVLLFCVMCLVANVKSEKAVILNFELPNIRPNILPRSWKTDWPQFHLRKEKVTHLSANCSLKMDTFSNENRIRKLIY